MKNMLRKEPLALITLAVTLILHFVPGYTELVDLLRSKEIEEITLDCAEPVREDLLLYASEPDSEGKTRNHITFPITCRLFNNTKEPVSIVAYGPALISNRKSFASLFGNGNGGITPKIAENMDLSIVKGNTTVPFLLRSTEVWQFDSLFALPYVDIVLQDQATCEEPTEKNIELWSGFVCLSKEQIAFTNFLYTPLSVGLWDWNEYGQVVELGDGREIYHSAEHFIFVASCRDEDPETTAIPACKSSPRFIAPHTWTIRR